MWQTVVVALVVLAAVAFVGRRVWRALRPAKASGCDAGCGCGDASAADGDWSQTR